MVSAKAKVINEAGMHMRPAGIIAKELKAYPCKVTIKGGAKDANAKSVMSLMSAAIKCGTELEIVCDGEMEQEALDMLVKMVESGLGDL